MKRLPLMVILFIQARVWAADLHAGGALQYATSFRRGEDQGWAVSGVLGARVGDLLSLEVGGRWARLEWGSGRQLRLAALGAGGRLDFDILWIAPYVSLRLGWLRIDGGERQDGLGVFLGAGIDMQLSYFFSLGFAAEYQGMLSNFSGYPAFGFFGLQATFILPL